METFSTSCAHKDGTTTKINIAITPAARSFVENAVKNPDEMLSKCVWRFIWGLTEANLVSGDEVRFTLERESVVRILAALKEVDSKASADL
jgi:hypothetical protein